MVESQAVDCRGEKRVECAVLLAQCKQSEAFRVWWVQRFKLLQQREIECWQGEYPCL